MGRSSGRSSGGGGVRRGPAPSFGSRSSHSSAAPSSQTRTQERPTTHAPPPATTGAHAPSHQQPHYQQQAPQAPAGGGGLLAGLAGTVMQGMAFGGGSAIAHRAVDSIAGPRTVVHEHQGAAAPGQVQPMPEAQGAAVMHALDTGSPQLNRQVEKACGDEVLQFQKCLTDNNNNLNTCSFYFDVLNQCQRSVKENAQWSQ